MGPKLFETLTCAANLACHSNFADQGFRQKDVRFFLDLFSNWLRSRISESRFRIHNTQVQRSMNDMVRRGLMKSTGVRLNTRYTMTRLGLLELLQSLVRNPQSQSWLEFQFVHYFTSAYGARIHELIRRRESGYPRSLQVEINALLDADYLLSSRISLLDSEIAKLRARMEETEDLIKWVDKQSGVPLDDIIERAARLFPYDLQGQKPMTVLLAEIPAEQRLWELTQGNRLRVDLLWRGLLDDLIAEKKVVQSLLARSKK